MTSSTQDPLTLKQCLGQNASQLAGTLTRARRLSEINRHLSEWSPEPWVAHLRIANVRGDTLVIYSISATALVPLRYRSASLLAWLGSRYQLVCTRVETRVRPPPADAKR
jgi:hypothetical protein